jgi:hypothetical protein
MTRVGLPIFSITLAMVKVFPLPVTPSKVWYLLLFFKPSTSVEMAFGWSPAGKYLLFKLKPIHFLAKHIAHPTKQS